jgi:predicted DNA-binding WGR domain protein
MTGKARNATKAKSKPPGWRMKTRMVNQNAKKFLELEVVGTRLTVTRGNLATGEVEKRTTKTFESNHRARQARDWEANKAQVHRGYVEAGGSKPRPRTTRRS